MKTKIRYPWKCDSCESERVACVQKNVDVTSKIISIGEKEIEYAEAKIDDGSQEVTFQCEGCGKLIATNDEDLRLKLQEDYLVVPPAFVDGLMIVISDKEEKDMRKSIVRYLKNKGIEIEEK